MKFVKDLNDLSKSDVAIAGGKGASLGEMIQASIPVPSGFVILSTAFEKFLEETDLNVEINSILCTVNYKKIYTIENASDKIRALIVGAKIPEDIVSEIQKSFKIFGVKYVAVRSSTTAEDSANAAWAGQLESFLNITEESLLEKVKKCWASLYTPRAIFYCFEKRLHRQKISIAVVIQKMVESEVSGVAFSVHPITQDENQIVIEAGFGLGEIIIFGQIIPDSYVIGKSNLSILDKNVNKQERAIIRSKISGSEWRIIPSKKQEQQKLSDNEILKLAKLIIRVEDFFGFPVDIEWAKEKNKFYVTQSRPITTLKNISKNKQSIFDYIKSQKWFSAVRANKSLLLYSTKRSGYVQYIKKEYGVGFAETLLVPLKKNYLVRIFNFWQEKNFHIISNKKILKNPQILISYIKKNDLLYQDIEIYSKKLIITVKKNNYQESIGLFNKILGLYEIASAQFIIIFSLGFKLIENKDNLKNIKNIIKKHDTWRNGVTFKEKTMAKNLFYFFKFLIKKKKLKLTPLSLIKFLTINEIEAWLNKKLTNTKIKNIIKSRKDHDFIYLDLINKKKVIDNPVEIIKIQKYFLKLDKNLKKLKNNNEIVGQVAYNSNNILKGRVIVIKDEFELKKKNYLINGKILITVQSSPHHISYLKKAKAIITDDGGLTCHAAILAREFKIPCIVGTRIATQVLKDNNFVEIDTIKGIIKIIR